MLRKIGSKRIKEDEKSQLIDAATKYFAAMTGKLPKGTKIRLFGSILSEKFCDASDIDCAILLPAGADLRSTRKAFFRDYKPFAWPMDLLFVSHEVYLQKTQEPSVYQDIDQDGIEIHQFG